MNNKKQHSTLTPNGISNMWVIGLNTSMMILAATTPHVVRTTGILDKSFMTDKSQLNYNQLSLHYGYFYVEYLKVGVNSISQFIGGTLYTHNLGFKKFFPCTDEKS